MSTSSSPRRPPRFCGQCGAALPLDSPRFCIECGHPITQARDANGDAADVSSGAADAVTGPTVRLPNAPGAQIVLGGTVKLPTSGAIPPGLWLVPEHPGASDVAAIYAPLHAVVGGWSATTADEWRKLGHTPAGDGSTRELVRFEVEREWFAAPGCANDMRLHIRIGVSSLAEEGRTRRGFRYRISADPPMEVVDAWWVDSHKQPRRELPIPAIQIMAPPRVRRVSDYHETILRMNAREAEVWAGASVLQGVYRMPDPIQQRTPVGRGIPLLEVRGGVLLNRLTGLRQRLHRVLLRNPLVVGVGAWAPLLEHIRHDARGLGLDMENDAMIEWWIERHAYDGALFEDRSHPFSRGRTVVAFRRSQIAEVE